MAYRQMGMGQMYQQGPQMGFPGGMPGGGQFAAPPGAMAMTNPAAGTSYGSLSWADLWNPNRNAAPKRPGFGDLTGLDWTMAGVGLATDVGNWWEQRASRKEQERQFNELMAEREREREEERQRQTNIATSWNRAVGRR